MLLKDLKLVGLAVMLMLVGSSLSWAASTQEGVTVDPGTVEAADAAQQAIISDMLSKMMSAGYHPREFDFSKAIVEPLGQAVFVPVRVTEEVKRQIDQFVAM